MNALAFRDHMVAENFHLSEFLRSDVAMRLGIKNEPTPEHLTNIKAVLAPGMQRIRDIIRCPITITSGYRSELLNSSVGGSKLSQHCRGLAADFVAPRYGDPITICRAIVEHADEIDFDQLIFEGAWVHVSFVDGEAQKPRRSVLTALFSQGETIYRMGLPA